MRKGLYIFLFCMWILIILGGGFLVFIIGPMELRGFGEFDSLLSSITKAIVAIILVGIWIIILSKMKNWIFRKEIKF